jgi:hypothetical protein
MTSSGMRLAGRTLTAEHWQDTGVLLAEHGCVPSLVWLSQQQEEWPPWFAAALCYSAAMSGHADTLRFMLDEHGGQAVFGPLELNPTKELLASEEWHTRTDCWSVADMFFMNTRRTLVDAAACSDSVETMELLHGVHSNAVHAHHHDSSGIVRQAAHAALAPQRRCSTRHDRHRPHRDV